jgi:hypothetical protein
VDVLSDDRIFSQNAIDFFNKLGHHRASLWFYSISENPERIAVLTDERVMTGAVLDAISGDNMRLALTTASNFSSALAETGDVKRLADPEFLSLLKSMPQDKRNQLLSGVWYVKSADNLTSPDVMREIASGGLDVFAHIARMQNSERRAEAPTVLFMGCNEGHDRGALLLVQELSKSFNVVYVSDPKSSGEIISLAKREGAVSILFSLVANPQSSKEYQRIILDALRQAKEQGIRITIGGGGMFDADVDTEKLENAGVKLFGKEGAAYAHTERPVNLSVAERIALAAKDMKEFLNASTAARMQSAHILADVGNRALGAPAGSASGRAHAPIAASAKAEGSGRLQASASIAGGAAVSAYLRSEQVPAALLKDAQKLDDAHNAAVEWGTVALKISNPNSQAMVMRVAVPGPSFLGKEGAFSAQSKVVPSARPSALIDKSAQSAPLLLAGPGTAYSRRTNAVPSAGAYGATFTDYLLPSGMFRAGLERGISESLIMVPGSRNYRSICQISCASQRLPAGRRLRASRPSSVVARLFRKALRRLGKRIIAKPAAYAPIRCAEFVNPLKQVA